ncbi:MAG: type II/IV secretion system ATPase subunit [Nitrososphaerales archaeon]
MDLFKRKKEKKPPKQLEEPVMDTATLLETTTFVETYPVFEPYVYVGIAQDPEVGTMRYVVIEPVLIPKEKELLAKVKELLKIALEVDVRTLEQSRNTVAYLKRKVIEILKRFEVKMAKSTFDKIMYYLNRNLLGYSIIDPLMKDPLIEDISCDGARIPIYIWHRDYESIPTTLMFRDQEELDKFILRMAYISGKHISVAEPLIDAALPDGSRIQMTYGTEVTKKGSTFTIRKFKEDPFSVVDLLKFETLNSEMAAMAWLALENKASILLAGGTASGKTTTINCLSMFIRPEAKIVTIEDTPEVNLAHQNWIQSITRVGLGGVGEVSLYDLLKVALRQRPDFIIVGEVRGEEASTLFQAIATGHAGLSSVHADSVQAVFHRLVSSPMDIPRTLIPSVNYIMLQARITIGGKPARRIISMTEVLGLDTRTNEFITNEVFSYDQATDSFKYAGRSYIMEKIAKSKGYDKEKLKGELENRQTVLEWMLKKNIRKYTEVTDIIRRYYSDPEGLLNEVRIEAY